LRPLPPAPVGQVSRGVRAAGFCRTGVLRRPILGLPDAALT